MRKQIAMLLIAAVLCAALAPTAALGEADGPEVLTSGSYRYVVLEDGTVEIKQYTGAEETVTIPEEIDGRMVTSIGDGALLNPFSSFRLTSVSIPDGVINVGVNPFSGCISLTDIIVTSNHPALTVIDGVLFSKGDHRLICYPRGKTGSQYAIPQGSLIVDDYAFLACTRLTSVSIPDSVTSIGDCAFSGCYGLTSVTIPDSVTTIGEGAFSSCYGLTSVSIPDSVTTIGGGAFLFCSALTSVSIPDSVTSIGDCAFSGCSGLTSVSIPDRVTSIGENAFARCPNLTLTVDHDSYAEQYAIDNGLKYMYPDSLDWLNG